ncbi:hypothetical protein A6R68_21912 [Neotoma lepida]|uniref:Uncharacterized protein n=1 Tax=Neotoma lepida TaxID=56216 RepID=A0A1A6HN74_NEOLE|nr:hypothetical protein A6R68_21912 [Neotoma lepida]
MEAEITDVQNTCEKEPLKAAHYWRSKQKQLDKCLEEMMSMTEIINKRVCTSKRSSAHELDELDEARLSEHQLVQKLDHQDFSLTNLKNAS